ncbi:hypothetical protein SAMN04515656_104133 [Eubacterium aggregans]|uniref:Uncharacterized protein n=1 Tax=Eubacterium aggregans TaxID=81409 RepID=A0A1H3YVV4_9FIRM|nr:hypothetical protein [Eubacterium aggregans]SEA15540.1 hypothetical protein SAMN04515656_104133 [Eubacterium aggregans]
MSIENRNIGFYSLDFQWYRKDEFFFDKECFVDLLTYIHNLSEVDIIQNIKASNKAVYLYDFEYYKRDNRNLVKIIMGSSKYNHSPNLKSITTGAERESDKKLDEGEVEKTHLLCELTSTEAFVVLEERNAGVRINAIKNYLNVYLKKLLQEKNVSPKYRIEWAIIPEDDFDKQLERLNRVCAVDLFLESELLGNDNLGIMDRVDETIQDEVILTYKVNKGKSLRKNKIKSIKNNFIAKERTIRRMKIRGKSEAGSNIVLDTELLKRIESVTAEVDKQRGLVDSFTLFAKMEEVIGIEE